MPFPNEHFYQWLAFKLPAGLVYHAAIRLGAYATTGKYSKTVVPDLSLMDAIQRWEEFDAIPK